MQRLETNYGTFMVYINRLNSSDDLFHISFVDKSNKLQTAIMEPKDANWTFVNKEILPGWILDLEKQFETLLLKELVKRQH